MDPILSIDTSLFTGIIDSVYTMPTKESFAAPVEPVKTEAEEDSYVDLSGYYSDSRPRDLLAQIGEYVVQSAHELDKAMVSALQNGYSVQDVCKIKAAQSAYKANCEIFKSTFELKI